MLRVSHGGKSDVSSNLYQVSGLRRYISPVVHVQYITTSDLTANIIFVAIHFYSVLYTMLARLRLLMMCRLSILC